MSNKIARGLDGHRTGARSKGSRGSRMFTAAPWCASLPASGHVQVKDRIIWAKKAIGQDWLKPLEAQRATEEFQEGF